MTAQSLPSGSMEDFLGQDERPLWKRLAKFLIPGVVLLLLIIAAARYLKEEKGPEYVTGEVVSRPLDITVTATGNLRPTNQVEVGSEVSGRIDEIFVDVNDRVTRGQVIARINTDVIEDQIKQARASLQSALASVNQSQANLSLDQAQLGRLQEVSRLSGGKVPSKTEMETAQATVTRDKASLASAQASVESARAALSSAETQRSRALIVSPVSGVVLARQVEPGQTVAASFSTPTLFVIAEDLGQMQLRVSVDEADVGRVKNGQKANFTVDAYPGRQFPATVERVDLASTTTAIPSSQQTTSTTAVIVYEARLIVENPEGLLRPGMTATAAIKTESTAAQLLVPNGALRFKPDADDKTPEANALNPQIGLQREEQKATIGAGSQQTIQVLQDDGTLKPVVVTTGLSDGRMTAVTSKELKTGMKVVTGVKAENKK